MKVIFFNPNFNWKIVFDEFLSEKKFKNKLDRMNLFPDFIGKNTVKIIEILTSALEKTTTQKIKRFGKNLA